MSRKQTILPELIITGLGLATSVGHDYQTACASIRAGLKRPVTMTHYVPKSINGSEQNDTDQVIGHPVFNGNYDATPERLMKLFDMAIEDLLGNACLDSAQIADTQLNLALPDNERIHLSDESIRELIMQKSDNPFSRCRIRLYSRGHAGMVYAMSDAVKAISHGICNRILVAGADSLIGRSDLALLDRQNRLKTVGKDYGLAPGEAASAVLIEPLESAVARKANIRCTIRAVSTAKEDPPVFTGNSPKGTGLSLAIKGLIDSGHLPLSASAVISDMNGETCREEEWNRIQPEVKEWIIGEKMLVCPASSKIGRAHV
jgi:3-oxoacyl-[acyl-carrier-protein] synthase-1